jgi:ADP-ribose pyrophosphatase YjhB (NUDIX family)
VVTGTIIRNKKGEILLVKNSKWKNWIIPGGHVDPGETVEHCALREVKEETGLDAKFIGILDYKELIDSPAFQRKAHFISFICILDVTTDSLMNADPREVAEYKWVSQDTILDEELSESLVETFVHYLRYIEDKKPNSS